MPLYTPWFLVFGTRLFTDCSTIATHMRPNACRFGTPAVSAAQAIGTTNSSLLPTVRRHTLFQLLEPVEHDDHTRRRIWIDDSVVILNHQKSFAIGRHVVRPAGMIGLNAVRSVKQLRRCGRQP